MVAPATANVIAKLAHGLADDMLTTTILASHAPKLIAPAMNTGMYENPVTQDNLALLKKYGMEVIEPAAGHLACGDEGKGKMPEPEILYEHILRSCACKQDMKGLKVLVTAGPTQEAVDPVRFLTNHSSAVWLQYRQGLYVKRRRRHSGHRTDSSYTAALCRRRTRGFCKRYV